MCALWNEWKAHRNSLATTDLEAVPDIAQLDCKTLQYWLSHFVLEVRKKDGSIHPANTLHHLCCGVMRHLREYGRHELDIIKDPSFAEFRATLDTEMKRIQSLGIGTKKEASRAPALLMEKRNCYGRLGSLAIILHKRWVIQWSS